MTEILTESAIYQKTPQEITTLLYEACMMNLEEAIENINNKDYVIANRKLQRANDILYRLGAGINYDAGIIADQLDALYNYMADRLIEANYQKDIKIIEEVLTVLEMISSSWNEALKKKPASHSTHKNQKRMAYEQSVFTEDGLK